MKMVGDGDDRYDNFGWGWGINDATIPVLTSWGYGHIIGANEYTSGKKGKGDDLKIQLAARKEPTANVYQNYRNYGYDWTSNWHNIYDQRLQLSYQVKTQSTDLFAFRPIYGEVSKVRAVPIMESQTVWETRELTQPQLQQVSDVSYIPLTVRSAESSVKSIEGVNISITAGGSVSLRGLVDARGDLTVNAGGNITVAGVPSVENGSPIELKSLIEAGDDLEFIAGKDLILGTLQALVAPKIRLDSGVDMTLGGQIGAPLAAAQSGGLTPAVLSQSFLRVPGALAAVPTAAWSNNNTTGSVADDRFGSATLNGTGSITVTAAPRAGGALPGNAQALFNAITGASTVSAFATAVAAAQAVMDVHFHVALASADVDSDGVNDPNSQAVLSYVAPSVGATFVEFAPTIATRTIDVDADRNIAMSGQFYATTDIDMRAGQGTARDGGPGGWFVERQHDADRVELRSLRHHHPRASRTNHPDRRD
jgi:hypothetical protein